MQLISSRVRLGLSTALAGGSVAALVATRPALSPATWSRGDELALTTAWVVTLAAATWLFAASAVCLVAISARRPHLARRIAFALPPAFRRSVEIALVASCIAVSASPARAANSGPGPMVDQPVVRAPAALRLAPTTSRAVAPRPAPKVPRPTADRADSPSTALPRRPAPTTTTTVPAPPRAADAPGAPPPTADASTPKSAPAPAAPEVHRGRVVVRPGDNLWVIARDALVRTAGASPDDARIARYWHAVIEANRSTLRSGNPALVFPGEIVTLPPVPHSS
jgi:hypothetical protein